MEGWLYKWLPIIFGCHCKAERSFRYKGKQFPICARCTGELVGIIISILSCFFFLCPVKINLIIMIPMIIDGVIQMTTSYESTNTKRFITGLLFGFGLCSLFLISTKCAFEFGYNLTAR